MKNSKKIISVVGLPGVGKTTTLSILKEIKPEWAFYSTELSGICKQEIQSLHRSTKIDYDYIQGMYLQSLIKHSYEVESLSNNFKDILVLDRGFEDTLVVSNYFSSKGYLFSFGDYTIKYKSALQEYFSDLTIFLFAEYDVIELRQSNRDLNLSKPKRPNDDIFVTEISKFYLKWYKENTNCFIIDTSKLKPIEVALEIISIIEKEFPDEL